MNRVNRASLCQASALVGAALVSLALASAAASAQDKDSCVDCHKDRDFLVTNKKLYDYFEQWGASVHKQEEVSCADCHGGDSEASGKKQAHGEGVGVSDPASGIYYQNVPETCGQCHDGILDGFQESEHFKHIEKKSDEKQGPTCVTCHGSINVGVLDVNSVEAACARCHNEESENHPDSPEKARRILNRFLSIHRFYKYISIRIDPEEAREFFLGVDERHEKLVVAWHTFDLDQVEKGTNELIAVLKAKRDDLRKKPRAAEASSKGK